MSIEEAQQSTQLKHILHKSEVNRRSWGGGGCPSSLSDNYNILLIKRTVYKNGIFKFSYVKITCYEILLLYQRKNMETGKFTIPISKRKI